MHDKGTVTIKDSKGESKRFVPSVCLINTKHPDGAPALVTFIQDDQSIDLAGGEEFMICWCPIEMMRRR